MASGEVYAIKIHMTYAGQQCRPGFYLIEGTGNGDPIGTRGAALHVRDVMSSWGIDDFSANLSLDAIEAQDVQPATERTFLMPFSPVLVGGIADANTPAPQDSMLVEWLTDFKGGTGLYGRRGRSYIPGIYGTGQVSGFLVTALQDGLSAFVSNIFDEYVSDGTAYQMHAVAFVAGSQPRVIQEVNPITSFTLDNVVAIQRSRRPGKGI